MNLETRITELEETNRLYIAQITRLKEENDNLRAANANMVPAASKLKEENNTLRAANVNLIKNAFSGEVSRYTTDLCEWGE